MSFWSAVRSIVPPAPGWDAAAAAVAAAPADSSADEGWSAAERGWCVASEVYQSCRRRGHLRQSCSALTGKGSRTVATHLFTRKPTTTARPPRRLPHPPLVNKVPVEVLIHLALAGPRFRLAQPTLPTLEGQELQIQDGEGVRARSAGGNISFGRVRESVGTRCRHTAAHKSRTSFPTTRARGCP